MDKSLLLCFLWIYAVFGLNGVDIFEQECLAKEKTCECGRDLTLSCKFRKNTFAIAWMNPNEITPIAQCVSNKCAINPVYNQEYNISYNYTECIFNLTIMKLTMKDNGRKLVCSDGTNTDSMMIRVRDYEPHLLENTTTGTIQAISGCITNVTKVSFKWIQICARSKPEKEITPKIQNVSITSCSNDSDCGNDQQMQYSEVISAKPSDDGSCYVKIVADYGNEQIESYPTVGRYMLEDKDEALLVSAVVRCCLVLILTAVLSFFYERYKEKLKRCLGNTSHTYKKANAEENRTCLHNQEVINHKEIKTLFPEDNRKENVTQSIADDRTEDRIKSVSNSHQDLPEYNKEDDNSAESLASTVHCKENHEKNILDF